ncbi:putative A Receptor for Ubiquitination Targets [Lyophyllum shimeji]|uniref:A Receptor for Ubiquitination Targets n=1 Tax=Lyophyllum shimeji TaxID=47721 RepID=A0A9P3UKS3_LYOSH|nr:putative A Receptor for Ubiquitination Targets [Lyophyllum shimeji]
MSLLQDVLRPHADRDDSDEEYVNVVSLPGTPDRTRPSSPIRGAAARPLRGPLHISSARRDPLKAFPTEVSQRIFGLLPVRDLARCALVSRKWRRSQTINYVWFQHYRKENFQDDSLPPGKWTKRESKQDWRVTHLKSAGDRSPTLAPFSRGSGYSTPSLSGYMTPRELKEEQWRSEAEATKPGKVEMRSLYKELGGRKSKAKPKVGSTGVREMGGIRDKGGWLEDPDEW